MQLRHPLPLLTREVPPLELRPGATWLLLHDVHAPFADPDDGALARGAARKVVAREFDDYAETLRLIGPNLTRLLAAARARGLGVVYSCLGHRPGEPPSAFQAATGWRWDLGGADGVFPSGWAPDDGEPVFAKPGWGALADPAFARFLIDERVVNVLVAGTIFDFGIRQTCYELADRGVASLIVADAVVSLTAATLSPTAGNVAHGLTKLRTTAEVLDLLAVMERDGAVLV
jgi:nicotinamidase-related amidase